MLGLWAENHAADSLIQPVSEPTAEVGLDVASQPQSVPTATEPKTAPIIKPVERETAVSAPPAVVTPIEAVDFIQAVELLPGLKPVIGRVDGKSLIAPVDPNPSEAAESMKLLPAKPIPKQNSTRAGDKNLVLGRTGPIPLTQPPPSDLPVLPSLAGESLASPNLLGDLPVLGQAVSPGSAPLPSMILTPTAAANDPEQVSSLTLPTPPTNVQESANLIASSGDSAIATDVSPASPSVAAAPFTVSSEPPISPSNDFSPPPTSSSDAVVSPGGLSEVASVPVASTPTPPSPLPEMQAARDTPTPPVPYWIAEGRLAMKAPLDRAASIDIDSLIWAALAHSPYVQSIQMRPQILETEIDQAQGVFDPTRFASSIWNDRSDPVGNTLTTGGAPRLNEHFLDNKAGVRKKNDLGGNWEAAQEIGLKDNNSNFFVPRQQADTRMVLRYTQPLMKGAGRTYNRASISIARLSFDASNHETNRALQTHVLDVIESYWELVYQRSLVLQLHRGITRLRTIETQLTNRSDLDAIRNQLLRARSAIKGLEARYARAMAQVVQSEERLRQLVNAPWIQPSLVDEIIPSSPPENELAPLQLDQELDAALMARPDVLAIRDEIKAANVRLRVAEQDLRPTLNIVTDFYVRGLNGNYDVANSYADQFATGAPSYSGGLEYLRPKNQTVANAIRRARDLEMRQLLFQLEDKLLQTGAEVRSSVASVQATHAELNSSIEATLAAQAEVEYLDARWQSGAFLEPTQISLSLEQLMDAEQRLIQAEGNWAATQSQYMIAIAKLRHAVGNLMSVEPVTAEQ